MLIVKFLKRAVVDLVIVAMAAVIFTPIYSGHGDLAEAEAVDFSVSEGDVVNEVAVAEPTGPTYPYTKTFTISAYYSPLPCQDRYATGSYEADIRLNGNGTNGADGTPVYPGMVAAPKTYSFGTKLYIPGIGTTAVHDRGGAIVVQGQRNQVFDRLDIWMGYGDKGLNRALQWGKRNVEVTVYGINDSLTEVMELSDYSPSEAVPKDCSFVTSEPHVSTADAIVTPSTPSTPEPVVQVAATPVIDESVPEVESVPVVEAISETELSHRLSSDLSIGNSGEVVRELQNELTALNYYRGPVTGYYGELTEHAVFKFQQSQFLTGDRSSAGAGIFGPKTRDRMNEILASRNYIKVLVASAAVAEKTPVVVASAEVAVETPTDDFSFSDGFEPGVEDIAVEVVEETVEVASAAAIIEGELSYGMVGPEIKKLQIFLRDQGFFEGGLITDYYGPVTREAVRNFQLEYGIIDGVEDTGAGRVGPATLRLINNFS